MKKLQGPLGPRVRMHRRDGTYEKVPFARTGRLLLDSVNDARPGGGGLVLHDSGETYGWSACELEPAKFRHVLLTWLWLFRRRHDRNEAIGVIDDLAALAEREVAP